MFDPKLPSNLFKRAVTIVVIEEVLFAVIRDVEIRISIVVVISPCDTLRKRDLIYTRAGGPYSARVMR